MNTITNLNGFNPIELHVVDNQELFRRLKLAITEERRVTLEVLRFFREAERRMLYAELGHSCLLDFAVKELGYSEPAAYRRISAMRVMHEIPEIAEKLRSGELNLTTISKASSFFRRSKNAGKKLAADEKREVLNSLVHLSVRSTEKVLVERNPKLFCASAESHRALPDGGVQVSTVFSRKTMQNLEEIQDLLGKTMSLSEIVAYVAEQQVRLLRKKRVMQKSAKLEAEVMTSERTVKVRLLRNATPPAEFSEITKAEEVRHNRYVSVDKRKALQIRSGSRCEWTDPLTGKRCQARRYLQVDHLRPFAMHGSSEVENLQLVCRAHNQLRAAQVFGAKKMSKYVRSLRTEFNG